MNKYVIPRWTLLQRVAISGEVWHKKARAASATLATMKKLGNVT